MDNNLDFFAISSECVRALRGRRSQASMSRKLGYDSSVVHRWESGKAWPTAGAFLKACEQLGVNLSQAYTAFFQRRPTWLASCEPHSAEAVAALLRQLRGKTPLVELAQTTGFNRYSISRWLKGTAHPRLPEFLALVEGLSRRSLDLVANLVDIEKLPSARERWHRIQAMRDAAYKNVWSHAVLRAMELKDYATTQDPTQWLAQTLDITPEQVKTALQVLVNSEQIKKQEDRYVPEKVLTVTTGHDPMHQGVLTRAWTQIAQERLSNRQPGHFGYSLFSVSRADMRRIRDLQVEFLRAMQNIIANSSPEECVGLLCLQLLDLRQGPDNALSPE